MIRLCAGTFSIAKLGREWDGGLKNGRYSHFFARWRLLGRLFLFEADVTSLICLFALWG